MNTSFNLRGEAIVHTPTDAIRTFFSSGMDALLLGSFLVENKMAEPNSRLANLLLRFAPSLAGLRHVPILAIF